MGRKIRDETEAMACLAAVARSSLSRREWARAHGIDGRSLNSWRLNLERRGRSAEMTALRLVEVFAGETAARDHNASTPIVLHAGPFSLKVPEGVGEQHLCVVLRAVRDAC
jgi:hypothetical protein